MRMQRVGLMNWIGAGGWAIVGVALIFNKIGALGIGGLVGILAIYALFIYFPVISALALRPNATLKLQRAASFSNWTLIALWCLSAAGNISLKQPIGTVALGLVFFVLPAAINIRTFRNLLARERPSTTSQEKMVS
jgi:hypothetical protein